MPGQDQHWPEQHFRVALNVAEENTSYAPQWKSSFISNMFNLGVPIGSRMTASPPIRSKCAKGRGPQSHPTCPWGHWPQEGRGPHYSLSCFDLMVEWWAMQTKSIKSRGSNHSNHTTHLNASNHQSSTCLCQAYMHRPYITYILYHLI